MSQVRVLNPARIYAARLAAGLTQEDLAHRLRGRGIKATGRYINRWERGHNAPRADVVPALADSLGVSIDSLYAVTLDDDDEEDDHPMIAELLERAIRLMVREEVNAG